MSQVPTVSTPPDAAPEYADLSPAAPAGGGPGQGWGDARAAGVLRTILGRWWLVLIVVAIFVGAAAYLGGERKPTYTATSSLNVGQVDVRVQALASFTTGAQSLASSYSRIATSRTIVDPVAKRLGTTREDVAERLSANVVADSPIFELIGTGESKEAAIQLTNAATREMRRYVKRRSSRENAAKDLLKAYSAQARKSDSLRLRYLRLRNRREGTGSTTPSLEESEGDKPTAKEVRDARAAYETAELQKSALGGQYQARSSETANTPGVELLNRAFTAESDRQKVLQQFVAVALVAGLLFGAALALLLGRRTVRRGGGEAKRA
jgi:uncharacterized protein involved in exopolysaccharide biosynthesis